MQLNIINSLIFLFTLTSFLGTGAHPIIKLHKQSLVRRLSGKCPSKSAASETVVPTSTAKSTPTANKDTVDSTTSSSKHHSSTASSDAPASTGSSSSSKAPSSKLASIFPLASFLSSNTITSTSKSWSVSTLVSNALPLSDDTLRPTQVEKSLSHDYVTAPDGKKSMQIVYPAGTAALSGADTPAGGVSFYAPGPENVDILSAKEVTFGYSVLFEDGFEFNQGGKLPGVYGGDDASGSITCSGGRHSDACFSARFMWRTKGEGESYLYLPSSDRFPANKKQCTAVKGSSCNDDFGNSIGRGLLKFTPGVRTTITQRVRLNDAGQSNGELQVWQDGESIFELDGIVLRQSDAGRIRGIQMQSFFGGHGQQWVSPKTQKSYLSDFSLAITEQL